MISNLHSLLHSNLYALVSSAELMIVGHLLLILAQILLLFSKILESSLFYFLNNLLRTSSTALGCIHPLFLNILYIEFEQCIPTVRWSSIGCSMALLLVWIELIILLGLFYSLDHIGNMICRKNSGLFAHFIFNFNMAKCNLIQFYFEFLSYFLLQKCHLFRQS